MWHRNKREGYYWTRPSNGLRTAIIDRGRVSGQWIWHATQQPTASATSNMTTGKCRTLRDAKDAVAHAWRHMMTLQ